MTKPRYYDAPQRPCAECPWRADIAAGQFPPERFRALASTSYDMAKTVFACHKSTEEHPTICAGFLARGAAHNQTIRLAYMLGQLEPRDRSGGLDLYSGYRAMAVANGVDAGDIALIACREERTGHPVTAAEAATSIES